MPASLPSLFPLPLPANLSSYLGPLKFPLGQGQLFLGVGQLFNRAPFFQEFRGGEGNPRPDTEDTKNSGAGENGRNLVQADRSVRYTSGGGKRLNFYWKR